MVASSRPNLSSREFVEIMSARSVTREVATVLREELIGYCSDEMTPHPDDRLNEDFSIDPDELEVVVENIWETLDLPRPTPSAPQAIPAVETIADLGSYLQRRWSERSITQPRTKA